VFRSLRFRLLLLTVMVAGVSLVAAALVSRVAVRREFQRLEHRDRGRGLEAAAKLLSERARALGAPAADDSALARLASWLEQDLILVGSDGRVIAASAPDLRAARIEHGPDGGVEITSRGRTGSGVRSRRARVLGLPRGEVRGPDGRVLGRLYPFPREPLRASPREPAFLPAVNRWLVGAVLGASALAVLLTLALSRRVLGPVESLTHAVRRLAAGDASQRVAVRSGDEIGELAKAFNAMADALERNVALRRGLVSDVAHELRTPLTNLRCQIESIQDGLVPATQAAVRSLHEETVLLGRLVDDLQELSLAEAGRLPLHRAAVPVGPAVEAALAAFRARAAERGITLRSDTAPAAAADADPDRLAQILRNLLANAIIHTPVAGAVVVSAAAADGEIRIAVQDSGPGIAVDHLPHIFDRFYRADPSRARATGGAGLGLAIVKQLVEAHGGRVWAENAPGAGARFTFSLPAAPS
jgi:signal transduction histidine kinase